jgi:glycosyltransferase involved in cell wall biosynthesis
MLRPVPLRIAVVAGGEPCPIAEDLASGLAARGHRVRFHRGDAGYDKVFRRLRAEAPDVVSQHAAGLLAFAAVEGLPVLHTLHVPPSEGLLEACGRARAWFATPSRFLARAWQEAGLERVQLIPGGVPDHCRIPGVVRPLALVADRAGALAALRAGLGICILTAATGSGDALARKLAHAAVCIAPQAPARGFDHLAAQAQLAGCPVVGPACEPLAEVVEPDVSGFLVAAGDERGLADAARRAAMLDRHAVRESARLRLALEPMLDRYESELRAVARRSAVRLVA